MPSIRTISCLWLLACSGPSASAQATAHLDPLDPVARDVRLLVASGLVDRAIVGQEPYSRLEIALIVQQASERLQRAESPDSMHLQSARITPAHATFLRELLLSIRRRLDLDPITNVTAGTRLRPLVAPIRGLSLDFTQAESPTRSVPRDNGLGSIDATLNPLLADREGRPLVSGSNLLLASEHIFESQHFALQVRPELQAFYAGNGGATIDATLQEAELRLVLKNVAVDIGRESVRWGQASEASLLTSANSPPLNLIRIANERLWVLPWFLRYLGPSKLSIFYADLGSQQNFPGAYFVG